MTVTLAHLILSSPDPVGEIGRAVRLMDKEPEQKTGLSQATVLAAKEMAQGWVDVPCGPAMKPVQDVCRVLLDYIRTLEERPR